MSVRRSFDYWRQKSESEQVKKENEKSDEVRTRKVVTRNSSNDPEQVHPSTPSEQAVARPRKGPPTDYKRGRKLGQGGYGTVYQCCDLETGEEMAVKTVNLPSGSEAAKKELRALQNEMTLLTECKHERIVQYYGMTRIRDGFLIFLELLPGGSVAEQIQRDGPLKEPLALKYIQQILEGLAYLHSKRVIHRDVKGANVLRDIRGNVKLADFGLSRQIDTIADSTGMTCIGTRRWMAPEVFLQRYDSKADIWSVGCTIVEMLTGEPPKAHRGSILEFVNNPQPKYTLPPSTSKNTLKMLEFAFRKNPTHRLSASRLLRHFFGVHVSAAPGWTPNNPGEKVTLLPLSPDREEYKSVMTNFFAPEKPVGRFDRFHVGCSTTVVSIERIQNPGLYQQYMDRKTVLDDQNPDIENERILWHGTPSENTASINLNGFDPTKHNKTGSKQKGLVWFGDGAYFAVNPAYSADNLIAARDISEDQRVYQCKVLVGYSCQGNDELKTLPIRSGSIPYDSATDDVKEPGEYVIFQNDSAYPEYLITFKDTEYYD